MGVLGVTSSTGDTGLPAAVAGQASHAACVAPPGPVVLGGVQRPAIQGI